MRTKLEWWKDIEPIVREAKAELYELEVPTGPSAMLRVFICQVQGGDTGAVGVDDCARVSKRISAWLDGEQAPWANVALEVSSPGINRKLSRPQHFSGALGERVRIKTRQLKITGVSETSPAAARRVICGSLLAFDGATLEVENEENGEHVLLLVEDVEDARVDFRF